MNAYDRGPEGPPGKPLFTSRRRRSSGSRRGVPTLVYALLLAGAGILGWIWQSSRSDDGPGPADVEAATPEASEPVPAVDPAVPELDASDAFVRRVAEGVSSHPRFATWLVNEDLARRFVITVVEIAHGRSPREHVRFLAPRAAFAPDTREGRSVVGGASHARYDLLTETFTSLDAQGTAEAYRRLEPLFERAYAELGLRDRTWDETLRAAIDRVLQAEVPEAGLEVRPDGAVYAFVESDLESLTPAEKHLVRMGPENARRVQEKLRELSAALGPAAGAPRPEQGGTLPGSAKPQPAAMLPGG